ncbi:putative endosomal integral membrane protein [Trypanosoma rangeli]|uniref:Putative endosomal integral membrane protein n=1 Tax=Trypanosoma rangeli TaxID=5698 RepID=A0A3R7L6P6_TRYRA|nr:putative endosomal integral membrane protein [Trypanosoma rangeli]RNF08703.1 putative endosomal integral membrane protein [Trypanosoma rangeli]|eukprot:RNF08703.1 putative endosomal integral membrane protein [Trypanosoma rangeli]
MFFTPITWGLLACFTGTEMKLIGMASTVLVFAFLGGFSLQIRGSPFTVLLVCFAFLGSYAVYTSARPLKLWNMKKWRYIFAAGTRIFGMIFGIFFRDEFYVVATIK